MGFLKGLLWFVLAVALVTVAMYMTGNFEMADRLTGLFLAIQPFLPITLSFETFLVVLTVLSVLVVALAVGGCAVLAVTMAGRLASLKQREMAQAAAAKREIKLVLDEHQQQYQHLLTLGQTLTKRLDKRVIVQAIVEAASRATSVNQANSAVSVWLLHIDTDTIKFEMGRYCDEAFFAKTEFLPTEPPFARVVTTQNTWTRTEKDGPEALWKPDRAAQLGAATEQMIVPLVIEGSVLGFLVIRCHPDVIKGYEQQRLFYEAIWEELTLALAIAVQGEVAILDRLTGVHNREYFMKRLIQEIERANRFKLPISLLMVDIDNFKAVNDTLGHPQGDAVLKIVSKLIKKEIRAIDLAGRYGGEEFIIMLPETGYGEDAGTAAGALIVAERIRKAVYEEFVGMQKPLNLSVSLGVAVRRFPQDRESDYKELIRLADEQLYKAKTTGKNKVCAVQHEKQAAASE
jgi:diguanylate cyclase (GGDEF)-like protein